MFLEVHAKSGDNFIQTSRNSNSRRVDATVFFSLVSIVINPIEIGSAPKNRVYCPLSRFAFIAEEGMGERTAFTGHLSLYTVNGLFA